MREHSTLDMRIGIYLLSSKPVPADDELVHLLQPAPGQVVRASLRAHVHGLALGRDDCLFIGTVGGEALVRAECYCEVASEFLVIGKRYHEVPGPAAIRLTSLLKHIRFPQMNLCKERLLILLCVSFV